MRLVEYLDVALLSAAIFSGASLLIRYFPDNYGLIVVVVGIIVLAIATCILILSYPGRQMLSQQLGADPGVLVCRAAFILVGLIIGIIGGAF